MHKRYPFNQAKVKFARIIQKTPVWNEYETRDSIITMYTKWSYNCAIHFNFAKYTFPEWGTYKKKIVIYISLRTQKMQTI